MDAIFLVVLLVVITFGIMGIVFGHATRESGTVSRTLSVMKWIYLGLFILCGLPGVYFAFFTASGEGHGVGAALIVFGAFLLVCALASGFAFLQIRKAERPTSKTSD